MIRWDESAKIYHVGARAAELEFMRYMPRHELTSALDDCGVVQVVGGSPAVGYAASRCTPPMFLQMATFIAWERPSATRNLTRYRKAWSRLNTPPAQWVERRALRSAEKVFIENHEAYAELEARGIKAVLAPPGIDTSHFVPPTRETLGSYILSVGRLSEARKGYERMVHAYAELRAVIPAAPPLVLAGKGALPTAPSQLVADLGLESHVHVRSDVSETDMVPLLQEASAFWMTSYEEGLGLSAVEAMACGVPVVATETAGTRISVTNDVGALVSQSPFVPRDFARTTMEVLEAGVAMRTAARQRAVALFDTQVAIQPFLDAYGSSLHGTPRGGRAGT